ncbi:MAG: type II toxin-antitoxin system VapC family toxin [Candidatus Poribacteria bacterium]|nr:type II toxin-antitoxin system VapC family toxin [Candidatus Poribacteria bacterium]
MYEALMLDTSAYSLFKRGHHQAVNAVRLASQILIPTTVIAELLAGFESGSRRDKNRQELNTFLSSQRVRFVPMVEATAERYAHIYAHLRSAGTPIPTNDLWIAASAMEHGTALLTADGHFRHVPQILVSYLSP